VYKLSQTVVFLYVTVFLLKAAMYLDCVISVMIRLGVGEVFCSRNLQTSFRPTHTHLMGTGAFSPRGRAVGA